MLVSPTNTEKEVCLFLANLLPPVVLPLHPSWELALLPPPSKQPPFFVPFLPVLFLSLLNTDLRPSPPVPLL